MKRFWELPGVADGQKIRTGRILFSILYALIISCFLGALVAFVAQETDSAFGLLLAGVFYSGLVWVTRRGWVRLSTFAVLTSLLVFLTYLLFIGQGIHDLLMVVYPVILIIASLLFGPQGFIWIVAVTIISIGVVVWGDLNGLTQATYPQLTNIEDFFFLSMILLFTGAIVWLLADDLNRNLDRALKNEKALEETNRQLEEQTRTLTASEARWRSLVENAPDLIIDVDRDGKILFLNNAYQVKLTVGDSVFDLVPDDQKQVAQAALQSVFRTGEPVRLEFQNQAGEGGSTQWFATRLGPIKQDDRVTSVMIVATNTTVQKIAQENMRQLNLELEARVASRTTALESKARELEAFAYSVSHDLKGPLRGIDGYSLLLLEDYADKLDAEGAHYLASIRKATAQMNQLIDDLLMYSRLERRAFDISPVNLQTVVGKVLDEYGREIALRQVNLLVNVPEERVQADVEGLTQAVRNLVDNALKFTRAVANPQIEIGAQRKDKVCVLWVKDNGIGFDMRYHDRIFDIFQRLHRAEEYPGTGIGLALVRKVMQNCGGRVWAESAPGNGAQFFLELPV